jgi:transposase
MPAERVSGKPTTRRYSDLEKAQAVRLVRQLRAALGTDHGTAHRVARFAGSAPLPSGTVTLLF